MNGDDLKTKRGKAVRTALVLGAIALAFFIGSFFFLTD